MQLPRCFELCLFVPLKFLCSLTFCLCVATWLLRCLWVLSLTSWYVVVMQFWVFYHEVAKKFVGVVNILLFGCHGVLSLLLRFLEVLLLLLGNCQGVLRRDSLMLRHFWVVYKFVSVLLKMFVALVVNMLLSGCHGVLSLLPWDC